MGSFVAESFKGLANQVLREDTCSLLHNVMRTIPIHDIQKI